ncbi:AraC family transcriptional regulator [Paenibacillus tuaregi]|uniref:AraC family transcriptional regulator n=1 Tax=Paenibacillus tuaregi TaxID=1816681 RepID=UPI00083995E5|nr:AraC family transcriptional regulator [Paenibacillus tuaregi]
MKPEFYQSNLFEISRKTRVVSSMPASHYHDAYEILYFISGNLYYMVGDQTHQVVGGTLLFIRASEVHRLVNSSRHLYERITLVFKKEFLHPLCASREIEGMLSFFESGISALKLSGKDQHFVEHLFHKMIQEGDKQAFGYEQYQQILLLELLLFLNRKVHDSGSKHTAETNRTHKKVLEIVNFIDNHYAERLQICQIAQQFSISPSYLSRTFKETTGFTFIEYLNNLRIKKARELLTSSSYNITEIAEQVGFDNCSHFGRTFKIIMGVSPLSFRKMNGLSLKV